MGHRLLSVASEWFSYHGGLSTFNRSFCAALASAGHEVCCLVPRATAAELNDANRVRVKLVFPDPVPGLTDEALLCLAVEVGFDPDVVIGHGHITGAVAAVRVKQFYKDAKRIHVLHTHPDEIEPFKERDGEDPAQRAHRKQEIEKALAISAHLAVAVGPRLHRQWSTYIGGAQSGAGVHRLTPGLSDLNIVGSIPQVYWCLMMGRLEDAELKGVDLAAAALGQINKDQHFRGQREVTLILRGAETGTSRKLRIYVHKNAGSGIPCTVREYTHREEQVREDIARSSVVLIPSQMEGFGLVGVEALAMGVPILISQRSGLGELLMELIDADPTLDFGRRFIVDVGDGIEKDAKRWAEAIRGVLIDRERAFKETAILREAILKADYWRRAVVDLFGALKIQARDPKTPPDSPPDLTQQAQMLFEIDPATAIVYSSSLFEREMEQFITSKDIAKPNLPASQYLNLLQTKGILNSTDVGHARKVLHLRNMAAHRFDAVFTKEMAEDHSRLVEELVQKLKNTSLTSDTESSIDIFISSVLISFRTASLTLLTWPSVLDRGEWLFRSECQSIASRIRSAPNSTTLLLGGPGCGKSALLAKLGNEFADSKVAVLGIKADQLPEGVDTQSAISAHFGLPGTIEECVFQLASSGPVLILIDQLDALAGLVDLRSGRLNLLLNLVRSLDGMVNVHIVCSCRGFERKHDARLASIQAEVVVLTLPTWEQVSDVLTARNISTVGWPTDFQELLRPPQHLKVFLQSLGRDAPKPFGSYQLMLDDLWIKRVTSPNGMPGRSDLLMDIASEMAERESLWIPTAIFEGREDLIDHLVGNEILANHPNGAGIGFSHQTLFEHAWARAFARQKSSLSEHVLARQNGLHVRPRLWAGLNYLRGADPAIYRQEFGILWRCGTLRKHIRHLLLEFLGQVAEPDESEVRWLYEAIADPKLTLRVLASIRGNVAWFDKLTHYHLPRLMRDSTDALTSQLVSVIASSWIISRNSSLELIRSQWARDPAKDIATFQAMSGIPKWDQELVEFIMPIVERTAFNRYAIMALAGKIADSDPALAIKIVASSLRGEISRIELSSPSTTEGSGAENPDAPLPIPDDVNAARIVDLLKRLISSSDWYGIDELAELAPGAFLVGIWPLLVRMLDHFGRPSGIYHPAFRVESILEFDRLPDSISSSDMPLPNSFPASFDIAVRSMARTNIAAFSKFLEAESSRDSEIVQRLLARGLAEGGVPASGLAIDFLLKDSRRFQLGTFEDGFCDTLRLLLTRR